VSLIWRRGGCGNCINAASAQIHAAGIVGTFVTVGFFIVRPFFALHLGGVVFAVFALTLFRLDNSKLISNSFYHVVTTSDSVSDCVISQLTARLHKPLYRLQVPRSRPRPCVGIRRNGRDVWGIIHPKEKPAGISELPAGKEHKVLFLKVCTAKPLNRCPASG